MKPALLLLLGAATLPGFEITTGAILGRGFDPHAFYQRASPRAQWEKTCSASQYRPEAHGKLMNIQLAQALFDDEEQALIAALDFYKRHGVLMIDVSLQGAAMSTFRPDGTLKAEWLARLERLLIAADERGMAVNLIYFHQGQDEMFSSTKAIHAAVRNITDWLIARNFRNILIDVASEFDLPGDNWGFDGYIPQNIIPLIDETRVRFRAARFQVAVSASSDGRMRYSESLAGQADVVMLHGNNRSPQQKAARAAQFHNLPRPLLMTGDDNGRNLKDELASCDVFFHQAAGWGYTPWADDMAYLHAVLDHIARLVLKEPPD